MKDPKPVNLQTSTEVWKAGWRAESRDADGHLISCHAPISAEDTGLAEWIVECTKAGETVTFWPETPPADMPPPSSPVFPSEAEIRSIAERALAEMQEKATTDRGVWVAAFEKVIMTYRRIALAKQQLADLTPPPPSQVGGSELLPTIKEFAHWHDLNEVTIAAGKTPSDSEIDFEATAWSRITRAVATAPENSDNGH